MRTVALWSVPIVLTLTLAAAELVKRTLPLEQLAQHTARVVDLARADDCASHRRIAKRCSISKVMVYQVISSYHRDEMVAVETPGKGSRRHEYLSAEQEREFLAPFLRMRRRVIVRRRQK